MFRFHPLRNESLMTNEQWTRIFAALQEDILDRKGIKWEWRKTEPEVIRDEISPAWRKIIEDGL